MEPGTLMLVGFALLAVGVASIWSRSGLGLAVFALPVFLLTGRL